MNGTHEIVELHFPILGKRLPADHAYHLYSALSRIRPELHESNSVAIHTIKGSRDGRGFIHLVDHAKLRIRMPAEIIPHLYSLAGKKISVDNCHIQIGTPTINMLSPAALLWARIVLIKSANAQSHSDHETFLASARKQLNHLSIDAHLYLEPSATKEDSDGYARRILKIKGTTLPGFGVYVDGLSEDDSLRLQAIGIGGRRKMGCGIFVPVSERTR